MAVGLSGLPTLHPVEGFSLGTTAAGIKVAGRPDLVVMEAAPGSLAGAVFTRNAFRAAPVVVAERHLERASPRYLLVNTGYANAGLGKRGEEDALACCRALAGMTGCALEEVLPFSTGVIGEPLPVQRIQRGLPDALARLSPLGWEEAASGIMTTDTLPKGASRTGGGMTVTGIAKGAGMIRPDMATMLAFLATDVSLPLSLLKETLLLAAEGSFNRITVDGDTSTNDACILVATGKGIAIDGPAHPAYASFKEALLEVCETLAQAIVRDGEGATKFITVAVEGGSSEDECLRVAYAVAESPLVKTAFFASDPNWGRILAAVGKSLKGEGIGDVAIHLGEVPVVERGERARGYREEKGRAAMAQEDITVRIFLGRGAASARVWTCDLSYDYVRINAEYRT